MKKSNGQVELECAEGWLETYRHQGRRMNSRRVLAMRRHVVSLQRAQREGAPVGSVGRSVMRREASRKGIEMIHEPNKSNT